MHGLCKFGFAGLIPSLLLAPLALAQQAANAPLPEIRQLLSEVDEHQKQLEKVRENYTFSTSQLVEDLDGDGRVTKTESREWEVFFVNGHQIASLVKKDGKPLDGDDLQKETERVTKAVEKAQKPEQEQHKDEKEISLRNILEIADVRNPRREIYRGRSTIVFDFVGRKDLKAHGLSEDLSKKLQGTVWVDEADRQVAHEDNFMLVKNWSFPNLPTFTNTPPYDWSMVTSSLNEMIPPPDPATPTVYGATTSDTGVPGQNSPTPSEKIHTNHAIVCVPATGLFYDPSYGLTYTGPADSETQALDGYASKFSTDAPNHYRVRMSSGLHKATFSPATCIAQ
jgi:hypothetical protein